MIEKIITSTIIFCIALYVGVNFKHFEGIEAFLFAGNAAVISFIAIVVTEKIFKG